MESQHHTKFPRGQGIHFHVASKANRPGKPPAVCKPQLVTLNADTAHAVKGFVYFVGKLHIGAGGEFLQNIVG